jgi:hypothetical protein
LCVKMIRSNSLEKVYFIILFYFFFYYNDCFEMSNYFWNE